MATIVNYPDGGSLQESNRPEPLPPRPAGGGGGGTGLLPDPGHLWLIFRRRLWVFLLVALTLLALVAAYTLTRPQLYSATSTVLIEPKQPEVVEAAPVSPDLDSDTHVIDTEVQILSSRRLAGRVADRLNIGRYPEFGGRPVENPDKDRPDLHPLADSVLRHVTIQRSGLTYVIGITAQTQDPQLSAALANAFASEYLAQQQDSKAAVTNQAQQYLQTRLVQLRRQASQADAALQNYKISHGLMSAEGATMAEQEVSELNQQISEARAALAEKQGLLAAARQRVVGSGGADVPAALQSSTVADLRKHEAELTGTLANLSERFGDRHPEVLRARKELADVRAQIQQQINRIMASLQSDVEAAQSRVASLEASQAQAHGSLRSNNSAQVGYNELERNALAAKAIYDAFLQRSQDVASQQGLIRPNAAVEALARVPSLPSSPNYLFAAAFGLVAAVIAGLIGVAGAEYLDARIQTRADVESRLGLRYLGAVPDLASTLERGGTREAPQDYLLDHPQSQLAEAFRSLRGAIMLGGARRVRTIAVSSALPREGKSTTCLCLARTMAESGASVVLVDCDARRRSISDATLPEGWTGLTSYLRGDMRLDDALVSDERTGLMILGSRVPEPGGGELFANKSVTQLVDELAGRFDTIILDTAPVLGIAETRTIAAQVDAVVLLARWRSTSIKAADTAADLLESSGAPLLGLALTQVDVRKYASTGREDVYRYRDAFAGYYAD